MVIFTAVLLGLYLLFAALTTFAPKLSNTAFRKVFSKNHNVIKHIFSVLFAALLVFSAAMVAYRAESGAAGGGTSSLTTEAIITMLICIGYFCLKDLAKSAENGEVCECCGDCSKCRIQCTSNEKYYGLAPEKDKH